MVFTSFTKWRLMNLFQEIRFSWSFKIVFVLAILSLNENAFKCDLPECSLFIFNIRHLWNGNEPKKLPKKLVTKSILTKDIIKLPQTSESKVISSNKTKYTLEDLNKILNTDLKLNDYLFDFEKNQATEKKELNVKIKKPVNEFICFDDGSGCIFKFEKFPTTLLANENFLASQPNKSQEKKNSMEFSGTVQPNESNIKNETCSDPASELPLQFKANLCSIAYDLNLTSSGILINAYSSISSETVILSDNQFTYRSLGTNGSYVTDENSSNTNFTIDDVIQPTNFQNPKLFAFGDPTIVPSNSQLKQNKFLSIRFIDSLGKVLKAETTNLTNNKNDIQKVTYMIETILSMDLVNTVFSSFIISNAENPSYLYLLRRDGLYNIHDISNSYATIESGSIDSLFPMLNSADVHDIGFALKLDTQLVLYKKSKTKTYSQFYIINLEDILKKNAKGKVYSIQI